MGKPTFDDWNSKVLRPAYFRAREDADHGSWFSECREALDFQSSREGMKLPNSIGGFKQTEGTETSQYLEERTSTETPLVVASERGPGQ
jgi:hypothetical protein